jgi:sugar/nucleoside kinase (ribokinase family)
MSRDAIESREISRPKVIGTGLIALDIVFGPQTDDLIGSWAGGTCGNVLTILSCLGWASYPVARLADDEQSQVLRQDLSSWGVHLDYVYRSASGSTPIILQHIRRNDRGELIHKFSFKCPNCGHHLPSFRPVPRRDLGAVLADAPSPEVFFFDRCSRSSIDMAERFRDGGAIIVFEPSSYGDPDLFEEAAALAHIVKYSQERWKGRKALAPSDRNWLVIETLGQDGLRYSCKLPNYRTRTWEHMAGQPLEMHKDTAGAGDWCTAGLIACLGKGGAEGMMRLREQDIRFALERGQSLAAWNCGYEGARGGMYNSQREKLEELAKTIAPTFALRLKPRKTRSSGKQNVSGTQRVCCQQPPSHVM